MQREHRGGQDGVAPRTVGVAMDGGCAIAERRNAPSAGMRGAETLRLESVGSWACLWAYGLSCAMEHEHVLGGPWGHGAMGRAVMVLQVRHATFCDLWPA